MSASVNYNAERVVMLSELKTVKEKEKYYQLLLQSGCKFVREEIDGEIKYVADVRLLAVNVKKTEYIHKVKAIRTQQLDQSNILNASVIDEKLRLAEHGCPIVRFPSNVEPFEYSVYRQLVSLISTNDDVARPKQRVLSWLMRSIEELYEARFSHEQHKMDKGDDANTTIGGSPDHSSIFPAFVVKRLYMTLGLKKVYDQSCWDLLYNTHLYRRDYLEVEIFARFLQSYYDNDDLLFFLYVRSVIMKLLNVSFKTKWGKSEGVGKTAKGLWMTYRECVYVSKIIFGDDEAMSKDFLLLLSPQLVGQKTEIADSRRIDIAQFLYLAVEGYHHTEHNNSNNNHNNDNYNNDSGCNASPLDTYLAALSNETMQQTQGDEKALDQYAAIQIEREKEYLHFIIEPISADLDEEFVQEIVTHLANYLRSKLTEYLGSVSYADVTEFDSLILAFLQDDELLNAMESIRTDLVAYIVNNQDNSHTGIQ